MNHHTTTATTRPYSHHAVQPRLLGRAVSAQDELDDLSARVAGGLLAHGVRPGDRVELALPKGPALTVLSLGARRVGATIVLTDPDHRTDQLDAHLVFAWETPEPTRPPHSSAALHVPVGPDFLTQLQFWPTAA